MSSVQQWVLEWSASQNSFHIQPLERSLASNQQRFMSGSSSDWITLMIAPKDTCQAMADGQRNRLIQREGEAA